MELLLVIGVIAILASIVTVALNPQKQILAAADASRRRHAEQIKNAMNQYYIDAGLPANVGSISTSVGDYTPVCKQGTSANGCVNVDYIAPAYIATVPQDSNEPCTSGSPQLSGCGISFEGAKFQAGSLGLGVSQPTCIAPNLVGWWQMGSVSNTSTVADFSGNGLTGILRSGNFSSVVTGKIGKAISLNGLNRYVEVQDTAALKYSSGSKSFSAWVNPNATETTSGYIFSKPWNWNGWYNYMLIYIPGGDMFFCVAGQCLSAPGALPGQWHHVAATMDSSKVMRLYIDGVLKSTAQNTASLTPPNVDLNSPLAIGTLYPYGEVWAGDTNYSFDGLIDDMRIYNIALTVDQVKQVMAGGS